MDPRLIDLFDRLPTTATYADLKFDDVIAVNIEGDNALHSAAHANDLEAAQLLVDAGINVNQHGDLGYTPLHEACAGGHRDMVLLLIRHGADLHARDEGEVPFTLARRRGHDDICDLLGPLMKDAQEKDPDVHLRRQNRVARAPAATIASVAEMITQRAQGSRDRGGDGWTPACGRRWVERRARRRAPHSGGWRSSSYSPLAPPARSAGHPSLLPSAPQRSLRDLLVQGIGSSDSIIEQP
jgi:hypothetical protein